MEKKSTNRDYTAVLKDRGTDVYDFMGKLLKKSENDGIMIERLKVMNETARQGYNNGSLVMRACKYDYDVKRLELDFRRLELAEKKYRDEQAKLSVSEL